MFRLLPKSPFIAAAVAPDLAAAPDLPQLLSARYAELESADQALRDAEHRLKLAHLDYAQRLGPRPDGLYLEVIRLREQSRRLLDDLADLFLGARAAQVERRSPYLQSGTA